MELKERILACASVCAVSSKEQPVAHYLMEELSKMGVSSYLDASGNLHSEILGNPQGKTILLEAHMDQIGLMVSGIDQNGYLKFVGVGGIDERMLCGLEVLVDGRYSGVILPTQKEKTPKIEDLRMDVGLSFEEAKAQIPIGATATMRSCPKLLLGDKISGPAMDNRAGIAAVLDCVERIKEKKIPYGIKFLFSVGEELGLQGGYSGTESGMADGAIVVDVTHGATPDAKDEVGVFPLGCGAVICRGPNLHHSYTKQLIALAQEKQIPYEIEVAAGHSGTTAWAIQTAGTGIPTMLVSIPLRYMHSNLETLALKDVQAVSNLLYEALMGGITLAE